jgi:hypothetical protein
MRKVLIAIAALGAVVSSAGPAFATPSPRVLHARTLPIRTFAFQRADDTTAAYQPTAADGSPDGALTLRTDRGRTWTPAAPNGCRNTGAGSGLLAAACGPAPVEPYPDSTISRELAVTRLDGALLARLMVTGLVAGEHTVVPSAPGAVGSQWIRSGNGCYHCHPWSEDVNWRTGEVRELYDTDPLATQDLDLPGLQAPLCAPLRRPLWATDSSYGLDEPLLVSVTRSGPWALIAKPVVPAGDDVVTEVGTLHRCGLARSVTLPRGFRAGSLGDGWVSGTLTVGHHAARPALLRLADRRLFVVDGVPMPAARFRAFQALTFTRGHAYVASGTRWRAVSIALPAR